MFQLTVMSQWNHMVRSQNDFTVKKCEVTFWGHGKVSIVSSHFFWTHGVMFQFTVMSQWTHKVRSQDDFTTKKCEVTFWGHSKTHIVRSSNFFGELDMSQTWNQIVDWEELPLLFIKFMRDLFNTLAISTCHNIDILWWKSPSLEYPSWEIRLAFIVLGNLTEPV